MAKSTVAVIDYGMGNLHSVASALALVGDSVQVDITHDAERILAADRVILPGVGAIRDCMAEIRRLNIDDIVSEVIKNKPFLGICVGMQALMTASEENDGVECLNILPGQVQFFGDPLADEDGTKLKVPHMGWNQVHQTDPHSMWNDIAQDSRFYFVHSYFVHAENQSDVAATAQYGKQIHAALHRDNIFAVQFHPEKSAPAGLTLLKNFLSWDGTS